MTTANEIQKPPKNFYMKFLAIAVYDLLLINSLFLLLFFFTIIWDAWTDGPMLRYGSSLWFQIHIFMTLSGVAAPVVLILVAFLRRLLPVTVSEEGLGTWSMTGRRLFLPWAAEIVSIRARWTIGIPTLQVKTSKQDYVIAGRSWTSDPQGFVAAVNEYAGPDHPLSRWLREHWASEE
jgi:hypothetical protein